MRIPFRDQSYNTDYAFMLEFELENISSYNTDTANLRIQATFRRTRSGENQLQNSYPVILELHGRLTRANGQSDIGATLGPIKDLPISFSRPNSQPLLNLVFTFPMPYLQILEEGRGDQDVNLLFEMWGLVTNVKPHSAAQANPTQAKPSPQLRPPQQVQPSLIEVIDFERIETDRSSQYNLTIPRSTWIDRILPGLGYGRSILIELPLIRTSPIPEAFRNAARALDNARNAFNREDYRAAVKYGREVTEHLENSSSGQTKSITNFCKEFLEPVVGKTKSKAIDLSLNSTRRITNPGSHANDFLVDRTIAAYLIETLALNLRYISTVL